MTENALWVDKYRPSSLDELLLNSALTDHLKKLAASPNFPHLLFYGPSGAGKKTRITALLKELFGASVEKMKVENRSIEIPNKSKPLELLTLSSHYHIEVNPSDAEYQDRYVVQEVIKEIAMNQPLEKLGEKNFKVVVINEGDKLTKDAQHALRRTMEKYMSTCRLIICANSISKITDPVRSRCLMIRVSAPTVDEISKVLDHVCKKEGCPAPKELLDKIGQLADRNLRKALLMLEATKLKHYPWNQANPSQISIERTDWELFIAQVAREILEEQTPKRLFVIRGKLYELLGHCIPPDVIIRYLTFELLKKVDNDLKIEVVAAAAMYEHRVQIGTKGKAIFHIEAFVAKFMSLYKQFVLKLEK